MRTEQKKKKNNRKYEKKEQQLSIGTAMNHTAVACTTFNSSFSRQNVCQLLTQILHALNLYVNGGYYN
jgi:hypothetical protein